MRRRRRRRHEFTVSLFPFLCILAAVIGVLTLLISSLAMSQVIASPPVEEVVTQEQVESMRQAITAKSAESAELDGLLQAAARVEDGLRDERERAGRIESGVAGDEVARQDIDRSKRKVGQGRVELDELERQTADAKAETQRRKRDAKRQRAIRLVGGSGVDQRPYFVECLKNEVVIHGIEGPVSRFSASAIKTDSAFQSLLSTVKREAGSLAIIIFLIRPDGVPTYDKAAGHARSKSVRNGKVPLPNSDPIDLRDYHKVMRSSER